MAFIRQYMNAGDPGRHHRSLWGRLKPPKFVRRAVRAALPSAVGFIPGVGPIASQFIGDPGPRRQKNKRKSAGSGTRQKAHNKRAHRGLSSSIGSALSHLDYGALGQAALGAIPFVGGVAQELAGQVSAGAADEGRPATGLAPMGEMGMVPGGKMGRGMRTAHMAHRKVDAWMVKPRRAVNPANVKALRRSVRRVESFQHLVKTVERAFPPLRHARHMQASGSRGRGHKAGCGCFACRKRG